MTKSNDNKPSDKLKLLLEDKGWRGKLVRANLEPSKQLKFNIDETFTLHFAKKGAHSKLTHLRSIITAVFPEEPSITFSTILPIFSRIWWQVKHNWKREDIESFKCMDEPITTDKYSEYKIFHTYQHRITKVQLVHLGILRDLISTNLKELPTSRKRAELSLRMWGLNCLIREIEEDKWPKLLLVVDKDLELPEGMHPYTATPLYRSVITRGEGKEDHHGTFHYSPFKSKNIISLYDRAWKCAFTSGEKSSTWPKISKPEHIELYTEGCKEHNIRCVNKVKEVISEMLHSSLNSQPGVMPPSPRGEGTTNTEGLSTSQNFYIGEMSGGTINAINNAKLSQTEYIQNNIQGIAYQLPKLLEAMQSMAVTSRSSSNEKNIQNAIKAANKNDFAKVVKLLYAAGPHIYGIAKDIGVSLITNFINTYCFGK